MLKNLSFCLIWIVGHFSVSWRTLPVKLIPDIRKTRLLSLAGKHTEKFFQKSLRIRVEELCDRRVEWALVEKLPEKAD